MVVLNIINDMYSDITFSTGVNFDDYILEIYSKNPDEFEKEIHDEDEYNDFLYRLNATASSDEYDYYRDKNIDEVIDDAELVTFSLHGHKIRDYLLKNPKLLSKKIGIYTSEGIKDKETVYKIINRYKDILKPKQIYVKLRGNYDYVSVLEALNTFDKVKEISDYIVKLDLSLMEKVMYTYDLVRKRVYTSSTEGERYSESRDLSKVLVGNKIVCSGYSALFQAILANLNVDADVVELKPNTVKSGHERCVAYIKDDKYNIDGVYYFDPTVDSKRIHEGDQYLRKYNSFALPLKDIIQIDDNKFDKKSYPVIDEELFNELTKPYCSYSNILEQRKQINELVLNINKLSRIVYKKNLFNFTFNPEIIKKELINNKTIIEDLIKKNDTHIPSETMIRLLNNVRRTEFYLNPEYYPYDVNELYRVFINSESLYMDDDYFKKEFESRLAGTFNAEKAKEIIDGKFIKYRDETNLCGRVDAARLTRVLRNELERRKRGE